MRRILFYAGWALLAAAFIAGAAEPLATSTGFGFSSLIVPAYDLWYSLSPRTLILTEIRVEAVAPFVWDPLALTLLQLPAWLLLGIPGGLLTWFLRPYQAISDEMREDLEHYRESLLIIETLSRDAEADDTYDPDEDDNAPVHLMFDLDESEDEDMREAYRDGGIHANYASFDGIEEWHRGIGDGDDDGNDDGAEERPEDRRFRLPRS
ncbi:MAG: hypothetical protein RIC16_04340 [Rhodospirillales bacterium]